MKKQKIEHIELWQKFKKTRDKRKRARVKREIVELYYPFVKKIAYNTAKKLNWNVSPEELASMGVDGLYIAIDRFSLKRGVSFPTYAAIRIKGSIIDGIRKEDPIPRSVRINHKLIERTRSSLEVKKGRKVTDAEVIKAAGLNYNDFIRHTKKYKPLSFVSIDGSDICSYGRCKEYSQDLYNTITDHKTVSPDKEALRKEFISKLISKNFSHFEQKMIYLYYYKGFTMEVIAGELGMSESRISQIHKNLLPRLRDKIRRNPDYFTNIIEYVRADGKKGSF